MATTVDYIEFVMDSIGEIKGIEFRYKKIFGEYCVYANDKPIFIICNNTIYVKMLPQVEELMASSQIGLPYNGAKPHYILDVELNELTEKVIRILEQNTPLPKPRSKSKSKPESKSKSNVEPRKD